jgi:hypothetical protein
MYQVRCLELGCGLRALVVEFGVVTWKSHLLRRALHGYHLG